MSIFKYLLVPITLFAMHADRIAVHNTLYGLQQLRTVIPERLWSQEFALLVDKQAFQKAADEACKSNFWDSDQRPMIGVGSSGYYFLYAATTGETIRLDDRYLQFLNSPYWNTPERIRKLFYLQHNYMKVVR
jgi:hypothetical protein